MPLHPIYIRFTGETRLRKGFWGKLIMQVQRQHDLGWEDATEYQLKALGFEASSRQGRIRAQHGKFPPIDFSLDDIPGLRWR